MNEYHKIQSVFKRKMDGDRSIIKGCLDSARGSAPATTPTTEDL